jgi:hypothetical protein
VEALALPPPPPAPAPLAAPVEPLEVTDALDALVSPALESSLDPQATSEIASKDEVNRMRRS